MLMRHAENDDRINGMRPGYEEALKANIYGCDDACCPSCLRHP